MLLQWRRRYGPALVGVVGHGMSVAPGTWTACQPLDGGITDMELVEEQVFEAEELVAEVLQNLVDALVLVRDKVWCFSQLIWCNEDVAHLVCRGESNEERDVVRVHLRE